MTSELLESIMARRSIRTYLQEEAPENVILSILEASRWAPSAHNAQPWRFIMMTDQGAKRKLAEAMANEWAKDLSRDGVSPDICERLVKLSVRRFTEAPVIIIASITMEEMHRYPDGRRQEIEHAMATQSLAAAVQNLLLAAHSEGLGSCWFCAPLFCQDVVRNVLGIPPDVEPQALITIGYPSERPHPPPRKPLEEVVFRDRWGERF